MIWLLHVSISNRIVYLQQKVPLSRAKSTPNISTTEKESKEATPRSKTPEPHEDVSVEDIKFCIQFIF